jgi:hypothetical protein
MKNYRIGLNISDNIYFVLDIPAKNFFEAVEEWARITGHNDELFDHKKCTYFGWQICITDLPALEKIHSIKNPFQG